MDQEPNIDETPTRELLDLNVNPDQAEEAKAGSLAINFTKVEIKTTPMSPTNR